MEWRFIVRRMREIRTYGGNGGRGLARGQSTQKSSNAFIFYLIAPLHKSFGESTMKHQHALVELQGLIDG